MEFNVSGKLLSLKPFTQIIGYEKAGAAICNRAGKYALATIQEDGSLGDGFQPLPSPDSSYLMPSFVSAYDNPLGFEAYCVARRVSGGSSNLELIHAQGQHREVILSPSYLRTIKGVRCLTRGFMDVVDDEHYLLFECNFVNPTSPRPSHIGLAIWNANDQCFQAVQLLLDPQTAKADDLDLVGPLLQIGGEFWLPFNQYAESDRVTCQTRLAPLQGATLATLEVDLARSVILPNVSRQGVVSASYVGLTAEGEMQVFYYAESGRSYQVRLKVTV